jgi:hypothetical protein
MHVYRFERHRPGVGVLASEVEVTAVSETEAEAKAREVMAREYWPDASAQHRKDRYVLVEVWPAFGKPPPRQAAAYRALEQHRSNATRTLSTGD